MSDDPLACMACGQVHPGARLVKTEDGRQVSSYSEAWRRHCEARWVLSKKRSKNTRQAYLEAVRQARGDRAAWELREEMMVIYKLRQEKKR